MSIEWDKNIRRTFSKSIAGARHTYDKSPAFCDASLAGLLDAYPRERLGIWTFAPHGEGEEAPVRGAAPDVSGKDLLEAVRKGRIWLNLRAVNELVPEYAPFADEIFGSLQDKIGQKVFKRDMGVLISSPNVNVHYHLDIPMVTLFQVRGEKTVWLYPATDHFAPDQRVEAIALREREEGLEYRSEFDDEAVRIDLKPGSAITWPQTAPHRIQNGDMLNVSLSCEFMTVPALLRANAIYANGQLRRRLGARPARPGSISPALIGKAALARLMKRSDASKPATAPTPATFRVDPTMPQAIRAISDGGCA